jgi:hypothetical protein
LLLKLDRIAVIAALLNSCQGSFIKQLFLVCHQAIVIDSLLRSCSSFIKQLLLKPYQTNVVGALSNCFYLSFINTWYEALAATCC